MTWRSLYENLGRRRRYRHIATLQEYRQIARVQQLLYRKGLYYQQFKEPS